MNILTSSLKSNVNLAIKVYKELELMCIISLFIQKRYFEQCATGTYEQGLFEPSKQCSTSHIRSSSEQ